MYALSRKNKKSLLQILWLLITLLNTVKLYTWNCNTINVVYEVKVEKVNIVFAKLKEIIFVRFAIFFTCQ